MATFLALQYQAHAVIFICENPVNPATSSIQPDFDVLMVAVVTKFHVTVLSVLDAPSVPIPISLVPEQVPFSLF